MSAPGKTPTSSSNRWGSFLSQAVAGVESRLDNMLGDGDDGPIPSANAPGHARKASATTPATPARSASVNSRTNSVNRPNDRLQARLAKAMAAKSAQSGAASPRSSIDQASRSSLDRPSMDQEPSDTNSLNVDIPIAESPTALFPEPTPADQKVSQDDEDAAEVSAPAAATDNVESDAAPAKSSATDANHVGSPSEGLPAGPETAELEAASPVPTPAPAPAQATSHTDSPAPVPQAEAPADVPVVAEELQLVQKRHQEELQDYVERIDTLQAKLQYMSKIAAESAKNTASSAPSGSVEREMALKDERIALLMEEGGRLSNTEQKFRTTLKKLRLQIADGEKQMDELRKAKDKAISEAETLRSRLDGSENNEKIQEEARRATATLQKEIDSLKKEKIAKDEAMRRLEQDNKTKAELIEAANADALKKALHAEMDKQKELEDTIATLRSEKESQAEKARLEVLEWREKSDRATERNRKMETELKLELGQAESKLEAMRVAAEEVASGSSGDGQLKLVRQIETLQTQYATASDNWQGIEASLLAKVAGLEKERDDSQRRESEMRKKAREAASRCRRLEEELQDLQPDLATARQELEACREELKTSQTAAKATETALEETRAELDKYRRSATREESADAERRQWVEDVAGATSRSQSQSQSRPASPFFPIARTFSSDFNGLPLPGSRPRRAPTPGSIPDAAAEVMSLGLGLGGRRPSAQPPHRFNPPPSPFYPPDGEAPAPSPPIAEREDGPDETYLASPRQVAQDMISVSTVAAGPSVQLVERMSAAIRRLEAEKVAAREEMARIGSQRDEARADMVSLMKELETAKSAPSRVKELEVEVSDLNQRYQTTLEMLGEKSELVEELKADVQDVKAMYRELVERTVK